mmetsp:Transcript_72500/g.117562  ORF Transcript_72500/g.117562 Transcript_72500/m.117562 type:complete len:336 (-) Transcript_72500:1040-2047(-)
MAFSTPPLVLHPGAFTALCTPPLGVHPCAFAVVFVLIPRCMMNTLGRRGNFVAPRAIALSAEGFALHCPITVWLVRINALFLGFRLHIPRHMVARLLIFAPLFVSIRNPGPLKVSSGGEDPIMDQLERGKVPCDRQVVPSINFGNALSEDSAHFGMTDGIRQITKRFLDLPVKAQTLNSRQRIGNESALGATHIRCIRQELSLQSNRLADLVLKETIRDWSSEVCKVEINGVASRILEVCAHTPQAFNCGASRAHAIANVRHGVLCPPIVGRIGTYGHLCIVPDATVARARSCRLLAAFDINGVLSVRIIFSKIQNVVRAIFLSDVEHTHSVCRR